MHQIRLSRYISRMSTQMLNIISQLTFEITYTSEEFAELQVSLRHSHSQLMARLLPLLSLESRQRFRRSKGFNKLQVYIHKNTQKLCLNPIIAIVKRAETSLRRKNSDTQMYYFSFVTPDKGEKFSTIFLDMLLEIYYVL